MGTLLVTRYTSRLSVRPDPVHRFTKEGSSASLSHWFEANWSTSHKVTRHYSRISQRWALGNGTLLPTMVRHHHSILQDPATKVAAVNDVVEWSSLRNQAYVQSCTLLVYFLYWVKHTIARWLWRDNSYWRDYQDRCILRLPPVECRKHLQCCEVR